jgi:hypothetical protein
MPIDPNIALQYRAPQIDFSQIQQPVNQMAQVYQLQHAQQQNQLGQMQMAEYERARAEEQGTSNFLRNADLSDPAARAQLLGYGKSGRELYKNLAEVENKQVERQLHEAQKNKITAETGEISRKSQEERRAEAIKQIASYDTLDQITADINSKVREGKLPMQQATQILNSLPKDPVGIAQWQVKTLRGLLNPKDQLSADVEQKRLGFEEKRLGFEGQRVGFEGQRVNLDKQRLGLEGQRVGLEGKRLGLEDRRVALAEEEKKRAADPVFQAKMAQAKTQGELIAKSDIAAVQMLPKIETIASETLKNIDEMIGDSKIVNGKLVEGKKKPHPGFSTAVGASILPGSRFVPGTNASDFQTRFDQVKGESFLQAFESLKGGGSITNIEGEKGTAAINRMSLAQSEKEFVQAANDLKDIIKIGMSNAKKRAASANASAVSAPNAGAGGADPLGLR